MNGNYQFSTSQGIQIQTNTGDMYHCNGAIVVISTYNAVAKEYVFTDGEYVETSRYNADVTVDGNIVKIKNWQNNGMLFNTKITSSWNSTTYDNEYYWLTGSVSDSGQVTIPYTEAGVAFIDFPYDEANYGWGTLNGVYGYWYGCPVNEKPGTYSI